MRVYVLCEGVTEEQFVNNILVPYAGGFGVYLIPIVITTKRTIDKKYKGGLSTYEKVRREINLLLQAHPNEMVTTMIDLYQLPSDTPGYQDGIDKGFYERAQMLEKAIEQDINAQNFFANVTVHEFEALLFSDVTKFDRLSKGRQALIQQMQGIIAEFENPEAINSSPQTAPSKRIERIFQNFIKTYDGVSIAESIGITKMLEKCKHFSKWVQKITSLGE